MRVLLSFVKIKMIIPFTKQWFLEREKTCGVPRSPKWEETKKKFEETNPKICAACGKTKNIQLHHIRPFHLHPELELDPANLIWLCENNTPVFCHLIFGHFGNFRTKYNLSIREDAPVWKGHLTEKSLPDNQ